MNPLSLMTINSMAPYHVVSLGENSTSYRFYSDAGVRFSVDFLEDDLVMSDESYQLVIANLDNKKSPRDSKVRDTIMVIVEEFFEKNSATILFLCATSDGRQLMRSRLFEYWYGLYERRDQYAKLSSLIVDEYGITNIASVILRKDNPHYSLVVREFQEAAEMLGHKPGC